MTSSQPYGPATTDPPEEAPVLDGEPARRSAPMATAALAVALVIPALSLVFRVISASVMASGNYALVSIVSIVEGLIVFLLAVTAAVMGAIVIMRRGVGRARAGAAIGVACLALWNIVVGLVNGALLQAFLG